MATEYMIHYEASKHTFAGLERPEQGGSLW